MRYLLIVITLFISTNVSAGYCIGDTYVAWVTKQSDHLYWDEAQKRYYQRGRELNILPINDDATIAATILVKLKNRNIHGLVCDPNRLHVLFYRNSSAYDLSDISKPILIEGSGSRAFDKLKKRSQYKSFSIHPEKKITIPHMGDNTKLETELVISRSSKRILSGWEWTTIAKLERKYKNGGILNTRIIFAKTEIEFIGE